ncbi:GFA family protein [Pseudotabrizicola sp. L79]|uniref:GFA family protein n=1 Tax=Pseudotabrizicola sp. L79 TaxID=3118402 RepID=UPI002F92BD56
MERHQGGCLCGAIRYETVTAPARVTVCHCRFCQRATGSAYMVQPVFDDVDLRLLSGTPRVFDAISAGSGKVIHVHFCADCGTKLWLSFERFPGKLGLYAGTFDDPCWFAIPPETSKHIFLNEARRDTVIPAGIPTFAAHVLAKDGTPEAPTVFETCHIIGGA